MPENNKVLHLVSADGDWEPMVRIAGFAAALREHGYTSAIAAPEHSRLWEMAEGGGVEAIDYVLEPTLNPFRWRELGSLIRESGAGLVHVHDQHAAAMVSRSRLFSPAIPLVTTRYDLHTTPTAAEYGGDVAAVMCPSEGVAAAFRERKAPVDKIRVVYGGANMALADRSVEERDAIRPSLRTTYCPDKEKPLILVAIAPLEAESGLDGLLEAMPDILAALPQCHLFLMGEGTLRPELERQRKITALEKDVTILEPDKAFHRFLAAADLYFSLSTADWAGLMVQAAMAAGRACILSDAGCHRELAEDGKTAVFTPVNDVPALKAAALEVLENRGRRDHVGRLARAGALRNFALTKQAEKAALIYGEVLTK